MGTRILNNLLKHGGYMIRCCETSPVARQRIEQRDCKAHDLASALQCASAAIFAVPDAAMKTVSAFAVPLMQPGSTAIMLDPAAAAAGEVALRGDINYIVCHPCHPPLFGRQESDEARSDFFGAVAATQDIVMALMQGGERAYEEAQELCRVIFAPVKKVHRITVEQMAILEPAMAEVVAASAAVIMREALEAAVEKGVPREAAVSFMMGHAQIPLAIAFGAIESPFSDAAKIAIAFGKKHVFKPDWKKVFDPDNVRACIDAMLHPQEST